MDDVFEAVDGGDFALAALVAAACDNDFVVFSDGDGADLEGRETRGSCEWMFVFFNVFGIRGSLCFEVERALRCAFPVAPC